MTHDERREQMLEEGRVRLVTQVRARLEARERVDGIVPNTLFGEGIKVSPLTARVSPVMVNRGYSAGALRGWMRYGIAVTAMVFAIVALSGPRLPWNNRQTIDHESQEYRTLVGQRASFRLSDGTHVILAPASRLLYKVGGESSREVYLTGEAYFEVSHDPASPFTVHAKSSATRVLGTAFSVRNYDNDNGISVVVASGKVALDGTALTGGDVGIKTSNGNVEVARGINVGERLAWTTGHLSFDAPLADVLKDLARWYDVEFRMADPSMATLQVTGSFQKGSVDDVTHTLSLLLHSKIDRKGRIITISREAL